MSQLFSFRSSLNDFIATLFKKKDAVLVMDILRGISVVEKVACDDTTKLFQVLFSTRSTFKNNYDKLDKKICCVPQQRRHAP